MSQKQSTHGSPGLRARGGGGKKNDKYVNPKPALDSKFKENVVKKLYDSFQDTFDLELIASVAHTCQWDLGRSTEALMILGGSATSSNMNKKNSKGHKNDHTKNKTKSLPSTLKSNRSNNGKGDDPLYATPNGLRANPAHVSTNSLSSGQVWQRHYKSKPQSPGLLTMIPPHGKEVVKLKKTGSARSLPPMSTTKNKESPEVKKASSVVLRIQQLVQNGVKVMILMRGVPGSGKTHLAQVVVGLVTGNELSQHIFSTDDYFIMLGRGTYAYDSNQLPQAHNWNQKRVSEALRRATNPVVVDNTHTQAWEMQPYVVMAVQQGYLIEVLEPVTPWKMKEAELARRNVHSIPREKIRQMLDRYEPGWTGDKLLELFGLKYMHCGVSHVPQEVTDFSNSPLAQHRQHAVIETPEKPKRKKNSPKKKDRRALVGVDITDDREKQLEELNQLFAEYGKKMDPISKKKVLESGVSISEVVARMRKLQGNVLPLPKTNVPPTIPETGQPLVFYDNNVVRPVPNYVGIPRESPSESLEPDTMSSSNASETSECETDTEAELAGLNIDYGCGQFVEGEDAWEDDDGDETRAKSEGAAGAKSTKLQSLVTSSQEELSLIDFEISTPACSSQEELSLIDFDGDDSPNPKDASSSSSEEQETQLLTLQESLREVLIDSAEKRRIAEAAAHAEQEVKYPTFKVTDDSNSEPRRTIPVNAVPVVSLATQIELTESLKDVINKRFQVPEEKKIESSAGSQPDQTDVVLNDSLMEILARRYETLKPQTDRLTAGTRDKENNVLECKRSPDLEEIPLPCIPEDEMVPDSKSSASSWVVPKYDVIDDIISSWEHPPEPEPKDYTSPKPARPKNNLLGAIKKTGIQRDKSPEEVLRSNDLSWSSIPFTSSWEDINKRSGSQSSEGPRAQRKPVETSESSTNTIYSDFDLWKSEKEGIVKLTTQNRNINSDSTTMKSAISSQRVPEVLMLDKSSMTTETEEITENALDTLSGMFPDVPKDHLTDILDKCKGNILWAVELLLESSQNLEVGAALKPATEKPSSDAQDPSNLLENLGTISDGKKTIKRRKDRKQASSELSLMLKKQIEDSIHIKEELYNDKTLFIKKLRHGEIDLDAPIEPVPCLPPEDLEPPLPDIGDGLAEISESLIEKELPEEEDDEEEKIAMKLDPEFFELLAQQFGSADVSASPKIAGFTPVINIPLSLAHQIYCCWMESVNRQVEEMQEMYEKMVKEDELLATALQEQEHDERTVDLREIMDMELAMALYKQDQEKWQENTQDTIATKLSKQLLFEAYPSMDRKVLLDLFHSHGNSFQRTVDVLSSQGTQLPKTVMSPEFLFAQEQKLIDQAKLESLKKEENAHRPIIIVKQPGPKAVKSNDSKDILVVNPAEFREDVKLLHQRRNDCCKLAQDAIRKKSYSVASYFSHLASLYKERIREMNRASISLKLFDDKASQVSTKLDLHFLFVPEALQVLDLFLDHHIARLRKVTANSLDVYLITGRGQRSQGGISKIKPAVMKRLDQRNLKYTEDNPGMLKVVVHKSDLMSEQL